MNSLSENHPRASKVIALQDYVRKDKPKKLRDGFTFSKPLAHGWIMPYLFGLDELSWGRWEHWGATMFAGKVIEPIPQIEWAGETREGSPGRKMLELCLRAVTRHGDWAGWSSWNYFDYLLDWLLFAFGDPKQPEEPKEVEGCEGASARLYQIFNLEPLLAFPHDYLGDILAENNFGRRSGFFSNSVARLSGHGGPANRRGRGCPDKDRHGPMPGHRPDAPSRL